MQWYRHDQIKQFDMEFAHDIAAKFDSFIGFEEEDNSWNIFPCGMACAIALETKADMLSFMLDFNSFGRNLIGFSEIERQMIVEKFR